MVTIKLHTEKPILQSKLLALYEDAGWWPNRDENGILKLLVSGVAVGAWEDDKLVGFCRSISDGIYRASVEDVVVVSTYRNKGIGELMVKRLLNQM
ncbi:GNAT family N-acetyltransferase [Paenibacillus vandeheii]